MLRCATDGAVVLEAVVTEELRLSAPPLRGRLDRCVVSSKDDRALSSNGFDSDSGSSPKDLEGFGGGLDERRVTEEAVEETDGLRRM